jgi:signal transduction histidine kinase
MRNPLSAVILCADELSSSLMEFKAEHEGQVRDQLDGCIEAAQTIQLCAQHQKRIINDILTLSKLDSALLLVTPVDAQPKSVVQKALKMFESKAHSADIHLEFCVEDSFVDGQVDWVRLDPSRLLQVLINLIMNVIKFMSI